MSLKKLRTAIMGSGLALALAFGAGGLRAERAIAETTFELNTWQRVGDTAPSISAVVKISARHELGSAFDGHLHDLQMMIAMQPGQDALLLLIDTYLPEMEGRNPRCNASGCLVLGYALTVTGPFKLLHTYLDPDIPPELALIEPASGVTNLMPELIANQVEDGDVIQIRLAFTENGHYEVMDRTNTGSSL